MANESFDDFLSTERMSQIHDLDPFQFREDTSETGTLEWLTQNFDNLEKTAHSRFITYRRWHALYKGIHWRYFDSRDTQRDVEYTQRKPRQVVNFIWEMIDTKVSQGARFKIGVACIPAHDEQSDINNARLCKTLLVAKAEEMDLELDHQYADLIKYCYGHVFQFVLWDKEAGGLHPAYKRLADKFDGKIPASVKKRLKNKGAPVYYGDVVVETMAPDKIFPQVGVQDMKKMDHIEYIEWVHIAELHKEYPQLKEHIVENQKDFYDYEFTELTRPQQFVMVRHFFHRHTKWLPRGDYIKYTDDVILEWHKDLGYNHGKLPFVDDTDIDVYDELWGRSHITNTEQMQRMYNNIQSGIARDYGIGHAPKWVMPKGACNIHSLNNDFTIVEYSGPTEPKLVTNRPTSPQGFEVQDRLEKKIAQHSKVYDISRGEVPAGVTANSALRFLDEQESHRSASLELKRKKRVLKVYRMMLSVMGQYYKETDDRVIRTVGKDNMYQFHDFKGADFSKVVDIKLQNASSLPDSKTGRIATIVDLNTATQTDPIFRKEEVIEMLDLGLDESFKTGATVAVTACKTIIEKMLNGVEVEEPQRYENLLVHYSIMDKFMQSLAFKDRVPVEVKNQFFLRVKVIEGLMYAKAKMSQKFLTMLIEYEDYPKFFEMEMPLPLLMGNFMAAPEQADDKTMNNKPLQESSNKAVEAEVKKGESE